MSALRQKIADGIVAMGLQLTLDTVGQRVG